MQSYADIQRSFRLTAWAAPRDRGQLGSRLNQTIPANLLRYPTGNPPMETWERGDCNRPIDSDPPL